jgi:predicted peptidase
MIRRHIRILCWASSLIFVLMHFAGGAGAADPQPGMQVAQTTTVTVKNGDAETKVELRYWLFLPASYGSAERKEEKWPLLLFLHGAGERGSDLELVKKHGPPKLVETRKDFRLIRLKRTWLRGVDRA